MDVILVMLGTIVGVVLLTMIGCFLYYYEEDEKLDREAEHNLAYVKNLRAKSWCSDAVGRALDDAQFWNDVSRMYIDADLLDESREYYSMAYDILEGITGRSHKTPFYVPRMSKQLMEDAK